MITIYFFLHIVFGIEIQKNKFYNKVWLYITQNLYISKKEKICVNSSFLFYLLKDLLYQLEFILILLFTLNYFLIL